MPIQAVESRRLYTQIAQQLTALIKSGEFKPGQQLPSERDLSQKLGVSRPTVREALIALEVAQLIDVRVGVGIFVREPSGAVSVVESLTTTSAIEVQQARLVIEPGVAALAAKNTSPEFLAALQDNLTRMEAETHAGRWSYLLDREFHMLIAEQAGNTVLCELLTGLWQKRSSALSSKFDEHISASPNARQRVVNDHRAIYQALCEEAAQVAQATMHHHLELSLQEMTQSWQTEQEQA